MTDVVRDLIATEIAKVERVVERGSDEQSLYGRDLSCVFDIYADLREIAPDDPQALVERVARRLITEPGTLHSDPDYGYNVVSLLNRGITSEQIALIESSIEQEALKEEGAAAVDVSIVIDARGRTYEVQLTLTPEDPEANPLPFSLVVTEGTNIVELFR